ncbi:MAG: dockerin type I domain-containing protein [Candidatus Bathyarchaeota archaeon]|nr:dockerin type I domain-containing protein [Candidatus Bathyarchaeota archaeon]
MGDVNGDGKTRIDDVYAVAAAFGSTYGDEDWEDKKHFDINGDGKVRSDDVLLAALDFGNDSEHLDGSYSWYTNGSEDYQMWRNVEESCIDAIKGRTVTFGYWFLPESFQSYSSSPDAWTDSAGPNVESYLTEDAEQGQKIVNVADGTKFSIDDKVYVMTSSGLLQEENTIASISGNELTMENNLVNTYEVGWSAKVVKLPAWFSHTGHATVSGDSTEKIAGSYSVKHCSHAPTYYSGLSLILPSGMEVDTNEFTILAFHIRLESCFNGYVSVVLADYAGMLVGKWVGNPLRHNEWISLTLSVGEAHSEDWDYWDASFDWSKVKEVWVRPTQEYNRYGSFWIDRMFFEKPMFARAEIQYNYEGGSQDVYGDWVTTTELEWCNVRVTATLPLQPTITAVTVTIHGKDGFKAWIDSASFSLCFDKTEHDAYGDVTLGVSLYHLDRGIQGESWDSCAKLVPAFSAVANDGYYIMNLYLKIELLPNDGSQTEQEGSIEITCCNQQNDKGHDTDPQCQVEHKAAQGEQLVRVLIVAVGVSTAIIFSVATGGAATPLSYLMIKGWLGYVMGYYATGIVAKAFTSTADHPNANAFMDATDYTVHEKWGYPQGPTWNSDEDFVVQAGGSFYLGWRFDFEPSEEFSLKIEATVDWGTTLWSPIGYHLVYRGSTTVDQTVTCS